MGRPQRIFSKVEVVKIRRLRDRHSLTWREIGVALNAHRNVVQAAYNPAYGEKKRKEDASRSKARADEIRKGLDLREARVNSISIPQSVEDRRVTLLNAPHRSIGDRLLGCPPVGFSALDRKVSA
jgi:hypothetical protein